MVREPEDYFHPEESGDLSRYSKEAKQIKGIKDANWNLIPKPKEPSKPSFGIKVPKIPKVKIPQLSKAQIALAIALICLVIGGAWAATTYLSNVINTSLEVQAPEQMSLTPQNWPSSVIQKLTTPSPSEYLTTTQAYPEYSNSNLA